MRRAPGAVRRGAPPLGPPLVLVRLLLVAVPFLAALAVGIACFYLYGASLALRQGNVPFALFYAALGVGGIALGLALWRTWRKARASVRGGGGTEG